MSKDTKFSKAFDPPPETDPVSDLESIVQEKEKSLLLYAKKPDRNDNYLQRQYIDLKQWRDPISRLSELRFYSVWVEIEREIERATGISDGVVIIIPLKENPRSDRLYRIDYSKTDET